MSQVPIHSISLSSEKYKKRGKIQNGEKDRVGEKLRFFY